MSFRVNTNPISIKARTGLSKAGQKVEKESVKLATGDRIYRAAYDPAGLAISESLNVQARSYRAAQKNANQSISMFQVADGALGSIQDISVRLKELSMQAANDTLSDSERIMTNTEFQNLKREAQRVMEKTNYNGRKLLTGDDTTYDIQVGIHHRGTEGKLSFDLKDVVRPVQHLAINGANILTKEGSQAAISQVNGLLNTISSGRAKIGSMQARAETSVTGIQVAHENISDAKSKIRDVDYAKAATNLATAKLTESAATSVLAQANMAPSKAEKLL